MKQLTDADIAKMVGQNFVLEHDDGAIRRELHLSKRIPKNHPTPKHIVIDFHTHTEQEAWDMVMGTIESGVHSATVITGASGILKVKFQQWVRDSLISPHIVCCTPVNNGSFDIKFKKK